MPLNVKTTKGVSRNDHGTPQYLVDRWTRIHGFTVDVCATVDNAKVPWYFGPPGARVCPSKQLARFMPDKLPRCIGVDGLKVSWKNQRCFMNPPYTHGLVELWLQRAYEETRRDCPLVFGLLPACTDSKWWWDWVKDKAVVREIKGRIKFIGEKHGAKFASVAVLYMPDLIARRKI